MKKDLLPMVVWGIGVLACASKPTVLATPEPQAPSARPAPAPPFRSVTAPGKAAAKSAGLAALEQELQRAMKELKEQDPPPYFIAYEMSERSNVSIEARNGALLGSNQSRFRVVDVDVRVGSHKFDS